MGTTIAAWGNSDAVRIPRDMLRLAGLRRGDRVAFRIGKMGQLEIVSEEEEHRRVVPTRGVTFDELFKNYEPSDTSKVDAWPTDELVGAERNAWLS